MIPVPAPPVERALRYAQIAALVEKLTGLKPGRSTVWRWQTEGRLEWKFIGGRRYSTESAVRRMLDADELCRRKEAKDGALLPR